MGVNDHLKESVSSNGMPPMVMQTAGQAKGYATGPRLKEWGVWVVGREHERSAWQHIAHFLARYKQQHG